MNGSIARRANFHLNAAKNLYSVVTSSLDRHQQDGALMAVLMHLELALAFYVYEIKDSAGSEAVDVSGLLTDAAAVKSLLAKVPARSAKELVSLLEQPDSGVAKVIAWGEGIRRCFSTDTRLRNRLFSLEEGGSEVISSSSESRIGLYRLPHIEEVGITIDSVASLINRQRGDAEEY